MKLFKWFLFPILMLFPTLTFAQTKTSTAGIDISKIDAGDLPEIFGLLIQSFHDKNWMMLSGLVLAVVIWILKSFKILDKIKLGSKWGIRFSTVVLASLTSTALGLIANQGWWAIVSTAFGVAVVAMGGWETVGKLVRDIYMKIKGSSSD
jgi:hypothetical protein